jgi:hypothetical protein
VEHADLGRAGVTAASQHECDPRHRTSLKGLKEPQSDADETRESILPSSDEGETMNTAEFERLDIDQAATLLLWRFRKLTEAGHDTVRSLMLAVRPEVDIRLASDLLSAARDSSR